MVVGIGSKSWLRLHIVYTGTMGTTGDTTTVRVRRPDSDRLQSLARSRQTTVIEVVHSAIDALERQEFLRGLNDDYRRLRQDPERSETYLAERQEWDALI
jgi:predicted ATPase